MDLLKNVDPSFFHLNLSKVSSCLGCRGVVTPSGQYHYKGGMLLDLGEELRTKDEVKGFTSYFRPQFLDLLTSGCKFKSRWSIDLNPNLF